MRLFLVLPIVVFSFLPGCRELPYRVEFGFKNETARSSARVMPEKSLETAWVTWDTLHNDLIRAFKLRGYGAPPPRNLIQRCAEAVEELGEYYPEENDRLQRVVDRYLRTGRGLSMILSIFALASLMLARPRAR